ARQSPSELDSALASFVISKPLLSLIISVLLGLFINYPKLRHKDGANRTQKARFLLRCSPSSQLFVANIVKSRQ
ncbi:MAG: hypothetical protein IKS59_00615, partial [Aeriscardovia sp.]|nr:hypothetical protein [Aeriscardovia sp.]